MTTSYNFVIEITLTLDIFNIWRLFLEVRIEILQHTAIKLAAIA